MLKGFSVLEFIPCKSNLLTAQAEALGYQDVEASLELIFRARRQSARLCFRFVKHGPTT